MPALCFLTAREDLKKGERRYQMKREHTPQTSDPERASVSRDLLRAALIGGLALTLLFWMTSPQKAGAQDLLSDLALLGVRVVSGTLAPRCSIERAPPSATAHPSPRPAQNVNVQVYPPPPPPRSMNVGVWPEPPAARRSVDVRVTPERVRKPVGTWSNGGYVLGGSIPAQQPVPQMEEPPGYPPPVQDVSPSQEQIRSVNR